MPTYIVALYKDLPLGITQWWYAEVDEETANELRPFQGQKIQSSSYISIFSCRGQYGGTFENLIRLLLKIPDEGKPLTQKDRIQISGRTIYSIYEKK